MNFSQLRAFHAVAREGGFTRAARALNLTQPTISGQVRELEATYRVRLFERRGHRVEATPLGRELIEVTRRIFDLESEARQLLASSRSLARGHLRLGADAALHVIAMLAAFNRAYPGINVSLKAGNSSALLRDLLSYEIDVAVLAGSADDRRLLTMPLRRDSLAIVASRSRARRRRGRIALADLAGQPMVMREVGSATRRIFEHALSGAGVAPGPVIETDGREAMREAVAAGLGLGVISEAEYVPDDRLALLRLDGATLAMTEVLACLRERSAFPVVAAFWSLARDSAMV